VEWFLAKSGVRIVVHGDTAANEDELAQDLLSVVVNVFVARNNGRRSAENRKRRKEQAKEENKSKEKEKERRCDEAERQSKRKRRKTANNLDEDAQGQDITHRRSRGRRSIGG
jgi:D-alanyl-D-alanine carboxypeptidase